MDEFKKYLITNHEQLDTDEPSSLVWSKVQEQLKTQSGENFAQVHDESISVKLDATAKVFSMRKLVQWSAAACILGLAGIGAWYLFTDNDMVKPLQEQVVTNEEKPNSGPSNSNNDNTNNNSTSNRESTEALVATESNAPSTSSTQPILSKATQSVQSRTASSASPVNSSNNAMTALANMETGFTQIINLQKGKISTTPMYAESASYFNEFKSQIIQLEQEEKQIKKEISKKGLTDQQLDQLINLYQYKLTVLKQLQLEMNKTNNRYKQNRGPVDSTRAYFINI
ncbi:MAG TPA: hypothetical protein VJA82_11930 [Sediminibacterium sp.]|uniref:hypothetical protein n=1 Tax=Sediminibacterium sp. TaxID=1917865 RepID=UPI0008CFDFA1|nr:hypothetical protein [Sediminibacterium sp.]OHC86557.1 MAG: hypothetical protein A2472_03050 [Sphingobacteriia bacterium RIFOXYC2_FULL_35_18]OHC88627.1 MAG: hypothetical protein A2546_00980 [Sphingobacteriia bacterium RIFOXYD2_FULL_35_12]HLD54006.1 hypothetical protein [Sediminibacterium sp.]